MIPTPKDMFEAWLAEPLGRECEDPRFDVRRARPEEFERIWDVVDAAFGTQRPRAAYEWMYRANPTGLARCWILEERASGRILKTGAEYPWPIWYGDRVERGLLAGDAATLPEWQRKGLSALRRTVRRSHPWYPTFCTIAGPNEGSRVVSAKAGDADSLTGDLPGGVAVLRASGVLERVGAPGPVAAVLGALADPLLGAQRALGLRRARRAPGRIESVHRFDTAYDEVTLRTMSWPKYWCPHNADFLNWRYLDHPLERYEAIALVEDERPVGYAVLRIAGREAGLAEFAAEASPSPRAARLLAGVFERVREAGCAHLSFFSTNVWRHWPLFRRAGFLPYRTRNHLEATHREAGAVAQDMRAWQITPGDRDYH